MKKIKNITQFLTGKQAQKKFQELNRREEKSVTEFNEEIVRIAIRVEPQPSSYMRTQYGIVPTKGHRDYVALCRKYTKPYIGLFSEHNVPVAIFMVFYLKKPKSNKLEYPTGRPDYDNLTKPLLDALKPLHLSRKYAAALSPKEREEHKKTGVIYDDSQITDSYTSKRYTTKTPRTIIYLWKITNHKATQLELLSLMKAPKSVVQ